MSYIDNINLTPAHSLPEQTFWHRGSNPGRVEELQAIGAHLWRYSGVRGSQSLLASAVLLRAQLLGISQGQDQ